MKKTNQSRMADNYTSMSWGRGDKLYASDLTKMSRQVDSNENELVDLTTTTIPKIVSDVASNKSTLDEFAPKVAKIDVPEGSTIVKEIDKAVADLVNGAPETLDTIKEVADAIEQNGDAIDALNDIVTKNKVAIDSVDAEQKATAEKLATLDSKAVKYQEFGENRKTIQLANYDTISGVTTKGLGVNLAMVSKWDKADFGSAQIETNLNAKDGIVTINDTETVATVKQVGEAAGQLNTKFEGKLETVNSAIDSLGVRIDNTKEQLNASIESVKSYADEQLATKQPIGDYPEFQKFSAGVDPAERKTIQLANADSISGVTTDGRGVNVAMVSKWNKVDLGSSQVSMNLNSLDGQVTINDGKVVATLDDISGSETATNALIDKKIADYHKESDAKFVSAKTTGRHSTVAVSTADDEVRLSSSETNPTGSQGGVYVGSQLIQVMTNYKPSDRKEASFLMITPSRFDLKRRDAEGQMHEIELVDLITKANKVPGVEAGVEAVKKRVETLSGEVNTKTPLESFEAFKTETNGEIQKVKSNVLQLSNSVYTKSEIDGKLTGAFHYKGSVETYAELPKEDLQVGDVWNVVQPDADHHINAGDNVAWNGSGWDALCGVVDLSGYDTIEQVAQKIADAVAPKADKTSVDAELSKKATIEALNEHCGSFDQFKTKNQQALDTKADQDFVVQQLASKVNAEQHEADKKALEAEINKRVDKETYKTDKGVIVSELNNKVSTANFEAAKKEIEVALDTKQPAGSYVNKPEFDQFVVQYGKDKGTFALTAVVDEKLAVKADKTYVNLELAKKAEKIHSHVIADTEGLVDALAAKVEKETYIADKATFAIKTEVNEALAVKADNEAVKQLKETKVEKNVYDAHVEATAKTLAEKLDKTTHEAYTNTVTHALGEKLDQSIYQADKSTFALKTDLTPLATKAEVEEKLAGAVASVYRYKGSVATEDELPKEQNVVGDVWNVDADGANVAWDGEKWDKLGGPIDLSAYATIESVDGKVAQAKSELQPKIDANKDEIVRVEGKVDSHDAVFTKYQQTVDGKFAQEVVDRDAAIKVETDARVAAITQEVKDREAAIEGEKAAREAAVALLATKVELEGVNATLTGKFGDYYTKGEVDGKLASIYRFKGSVAAEDQLPTQDQVIGDVYNVEDTGMNVAWDGKKWDKLGSVINLTPYATTEAVEAKITETKQAASEALNQHAQTAETTYAKKAEVTKQIEAVDGKFAGKADKVHTHTIENITGLQDALDGKQAVGDYALKSEVKTVDDKFAGYTTTEALNGLLDGKAAVVHTHTVDNVTGLQAALDAKMAASEAAKFATHDHNHDQAYLAIKGKAESAKVADSVAWANVTGTEAIAVKSEVEAVDAKFASYTTTEALAAEYATKQALADGLKAKAEAVHTHVAADITDLQDKLDAKLDVGGKAESAKVADSVAWTSVTGTEGVALKSDLDSKMEASEASKFAQASHVHAIENVTGLQQALNDKIAVVDADGKYALKSAITGLATKEELNGKAAASHTHQEGEVEGLTAKLATFALKSEIAGFVTDEALKRDYTNTADLGQLLDSKLDTTAGDKKYATKTELNGYQPKGDYVAKTEVNSIVEAAVKAPVFVNIPLRPEPNYTEAAIANWFGCETIEQVGQVITGDKVVYLHFTSTGKDYKIPVQYCAFKADGSNDIILMTVGLDTANDEVCKYKITIALNSDSSTVDVNKTPLVSPAA